MPVRLEAVDRVVEENVVDGVERLDADFSAERDAGEVLGERAVRVARLVEREAWGRKKYHVGNCWDRWQEWRAVDVPSSH